MLRLLPLLTLLALPSLAQAQLARYCTNNVLELRSIHSNPTTMGLEYIATFRNLGPTPLGAVTINYKGGLIDKPLRPFEFGRAGAANAQRQVRLGHQTPNIPRLQDAQVMTAITISGC